MEAKRVLREYEVFDLGRATLYARAEDDKYFCIEECGVRQAMDEAMSRYTVQSLHTHELTRDDT